MAFVLSVHVAMKEEDGLAAPVSPVRLAPVRLFEAAAVLGRALVDDPLFVYLLPDAAQRASGVPLTMQSMLRIGLAHGEVWATPPPITGVACWFSPAHPTVTAEERDATGWHEVAAAWGAEVLARFAAFGDDLGGVVESLPPEPHWHLSWLGVEPNHQGQGIGSMLVRQVTTRADAAGVACDLFTLALRNVPIYEHLGFCVMRETFLPRSGLRFWVMARPPPSIDTGSQHPVSRSVKRRK